MAHNVAEAIKKNNFCSRDEGAVDCWTVIRWFKKFRSGCKKVNDRVRSSRYKTVDFEAVFKAILRETPDIS